MGWFNRISRPQPEMLDSVIGPTANLSGTIRSDGGLRIEGHFEGLIEVAGNVVVTEGARVLADIAARNVTVGGQVKGNISGTGRLEILSTGQVVGDIVVASVMIDEGGFFQGISRMRGYEQRALTAPTDESMPAEPGEVVVEEPPEARGEVVDLTARWTEVVADEDAEPDTPAENATVGQGAAKAVAADDLGAPGQGEWPAAKPGPAALASAAAAEAPPGATPAPTATRRGRRPVAPAEPRSEVPAGQQAKTTPPAPAPTPAPAALAAKQATPIATTAAEEEPEIDFDSIEPIIPEIVIEEPPPEPAPRNRRRGRTAR